MPAQSVLDPRSPQAQAIADLWWVMLAVSVAIFVIVLALVAAGLVAGRRRGTTVALDERSSWLLVLGGGVALPLVVLLGFIVRSAMVSRTVLAVEADTAEAVTVEVVAHQWWWEVNYREDGAIVARSPNELRLPVDRPARVVLESADVIHSFWVPGLTGKMDAIPGQRNEVMFRPTSRGVIRGQCAEFCGGPHALMAFTVVVEAGDDFETWLAAQRQPAREPDTPERERGLEVFVAGGCGRCHQIEGTRALGLEEPAPDLTHVATRQTLAAATMPNTVGHLGGWILDPQSTKPGSHMPPTALESDDFMALLDYLRSLR